jgi:uncharacterized protein YndB with AHSA1/START domain
MTVPISASIVVSAPPERVFAAATDWPGQQNWIFATSTTATRGPGSAVGDEIAARTGFGPLGFLDTMTITEWDPPHRCTVRHTGRVVRGTATFGVTAEGPGRSRFTWDEQVEAPGGAIGRAGLRAGRAVFAFFLRRSLGRFADWVEGS